MKNSHKAGFVNIIGNPNVGKSTLMNAFVGEKLSIITSKAQTTRHRILGIVNGDDFQLVLSDTPGIIKPVYELQSSMMHFVKSAFEDADIIIYMVEIGENSLKDDIFFKKITSTKTPVILLLNKIDNSFICEGLRPVVPTTGDIPYAIDDLVFSYTESGWVKSTRTGLIFSFL